MNSCPICGRNNVQAMDGHSCPKAVLNRIDLEDELASEDFDPPETDEVDRLFTGLQALENYYALS